MSFEVLSERLQALQDSNAQLKDLIERLATIKFQPGSVPLDVDDGNVMVELKSEIHQTLKDQEEDFELLQEELIDLESGRPGSELEQQKARLDQAVKKGVKELKTCQIDFRKAQLTARRSLQAAQRTERQLLLQSYLDPEPRSNTSSPVLGQRRRTQQLAELSKEEKTVNASSDVTLALRRTHDMMASELACSQFAHDTLQQSTAALSQLSETYSALDTLLSSSKKLLGTLLRSQKSDTWYLETAFYVLLTTIAWLVFRRFLYGPAWWLVWLPVKMLHKGLMVAFAVLGLRGCESIDVSVSSVSGLETAVHSSATRQSRPTVAGSRAPSIRVGGGGRGAPVRPDDTTHGQGEKMVSEQVARIIDEIRNEQATDEAANEHAVEDPIEEEAEEEAEVQRNQGQRTWEEGKEAAIEPQRTKDEL